MNAKTYMALAVVFAASLGAVVVFHVFPVSIVGDLAGVPAIAALFGALFQLSRDNIAFERSARLEESRNRFTVGAMSHMASVAFDKHVSFCEEYTAEAYRATDTLLRTGPHQDVLPHVATLVDIRIKWTLWLQPRITEELGKFEAALRDIGANAGLIHALQAGDEARTKAIDKAYRTFAEVMAFKTWEGKEVTAGFTVGAVVGRLREVLQIAELTDLRTKLIAHASQNLT